MKRGAEHQLTRDDDSKEESAAESNGMRKADDTVLATRIIRGLPKRGGSSTSSEVQSLRGGSSTSSEVQYYTSLRGLNVSVLDAVAKLVNEDPFSDLTPLLVQYRNLRGEVQKEYDNRSSNSAKITTETLSPFAPKAVDTSSAVLFGKAQVTPSSVPAASAVRFGSSSAGSLFQSPSATFSFQTSKGLTFTPPSGSPKPQSPNAFTPLAASPSTSSVFGSSEKKTDSTAVANPVNIFGSSASSFVGGSNKSASAFTLGSPSAGSALKPTAFGGFGNSMKPFGGSIGNPVGFGFGSPTGTSENSAINSKSESDTVKNEDKENGEDGVTEEAQEKDDDNAASDSGLPSHEHDAEGKGEEDKDAFKVRAYRMREAGAGWVELGIGLLRLERHRDDDARRVLLRNGSTGRIHMNFNLYSGFRATQNKKTLSFMGHHEGAPQLYSVRLATEEQARNLKEALES